MAAAITIIPIRWCAAATASCRSTFTCRAVLRPRKRCFTACCFCRRKSAAPRRSNVEIMDETLDRLGRTITGALSSSATGYSIAFGELTVAANARDIVAVMRHLRDDPDCLFWSLIDITAVDWPGRERRFDVVYHLLSPKHNVRIRVKAETEEATPVPSIIEVFPGADWLERETYDLYGVVFTGHPDMRRILTDYGFEGHPLRKDFPLTGFVEVRYDDALKRVVYEPVRLAQEFRTFDFLSPWEGTDYVLPGDEKAKPDGK